MESDQLDAWRNLSESELLQYVEFIQSLSKYRSEFDEKQKFSYPLGRFLITEYKPSIEFSCLDSSREKIAKCLQSKGYHCFINKNGNCKIRVSWETNPVWDESQIAMLATHPFV